MSKFKENLPLDGEVLVKWKDIPHEKGIYRGYQVGNTRRCCVNFPGRGNVWVDRTIISPVEEEQ